MAPRSPAPHDGALFLRHSALIASAILAVLLLLWPIAAALRDALAALVQARLGSAHGVTSSPIQEKERP